MKKTVIGLCCVLMLAGCSSGASEAEGAAGVESYECRTIDYYDYSAAVPQSAPVDEFWFEDSLFLGDYRLSGLMNYSTLTDEGADVHFVSDLNVNNMDSALSDTYEGSASFTEILMNTDKKNIFLMIGINDLNRNDYSEWYRKIREVLTRFSKSHKNTYVYLILPYHVESLESVDTAVLKKNTDELRAQMMQCAEQDRYFCIDLAEALEDEKTNVIKEDYVWDGVRLNSEGTDAMVDYLKRHIVKEGTYVKRTCS